jgi:Tripartite ATP-independent periplasmic transporters, DctQ component
MTLARVTALCRLSAAIGGLVLTLLMLMTCLSILGRFLNTLGHVLPFAGFLQFFGPVPGDFELVEAGIAFCVFAFLPLCQLRMGHATVELFTDRFPPVLNRGLITLWDLLFAAVLVMVTWRLAVGMLGKYDNGEITLLLQFPVWYSYAAALVPATLTALVAVWIAVQRLRLVFGFRAELPNPAGSAH